MCMLLNISLQLHTVFINRLSLHLAMLNAIFHGNEKVGTFLIGVGLFHMSTKYTGKQKKENHSIPYQHILVLPPQNSGFPWLTSSHLQTCILITHQRNV